MWVMYVDESGTPGSNQEEYFILSGVAVFERSMLGLARALDKIQSLYLPDLQEIKEFHAAEIRSGKGFWRGISRDIQDQILQDMGKAIANPQFLAWVKLFGVAIQQDFYKRDRYTIYERALSELCLRFDIFLRNQKRVTGQDQYGMLIFDESQLTTETRALMLQYRSNQHDWVTTGRIAEVPFFTSSNDTRLLQASDYVAYSLFRYYAYADGKYFNFISNAFYNEDNVFHGLKHLHSAFNTCPCPACLSRRLNQI